MKPQITWQNRISGVQSRNNFIIHRGQIVFGSSGYRWNKPDSGDGVYSINPEDGSVNWFVATGADVNEISVVGGVLLAPTDNGELFFINPVSGDLKAKKNVNGTIFGRAIAFRDRSKTTALAVNHHGEVLVIDVQNNDVSTMVALGTPVRASLVKSGEAIIAAGQEGALLAIEPKNNWSVRLLCRAPVGHYGGPSSIAIEPLVVGDRIYVSYTRETYYDDPPLFCFDLKRSQIIWEARSRDNKGYGNLRSSPIMVAGKLIIAPAYSDSLVLVSPKTGRVMADVRLGQSVFQQWSGPVRLTNKHVAIGRVDGVCSIVDVKRGKLSSSISLVTADSERLWDKAGSSPSVPEQLYPGEPAPDGGIVGTPFQTGSALFVGTTDGHIARIDLSWIG